MTVFLLSMLWAHVLLYNFNLPNSTLGAFQIGWRLSIPPDFAVPERSLYLPASSNYIQSVKMGLLWMRLLDVGISYRCTLNAAQILMVLRNFEHVYPAWKSMCRSDTRCLHCNCGVLLNDHTLVSEIDLTLIMIRVDLVGIGFELFPMVYSITVGNMSIPNSMFFFLWFVHKSNLPSTTLTKLIF